MRMKKLLLTNRHLQDLNPLIAGEEICAASHRFGPFVRKYTLIHYVIKGKGVFYARGKEYPVEAGQAFLFLPDEVTTYQADTLDPWHYQWIGFDGSLSTQFAQLPPVFPVKEEIFRKAFHSISDPATLEFHLASALFLLYASLFSKKVNTNQHVQRVQSYIQTSYMQAVRVEDIAMHLNLDRRYLSRLFKKKTGQSIQDYLIQTRLDAALQHLEDGYSVTEAAILCGYEDVSNFSKMFKKRYGISPAGMKQPSAE